MEALAGNFRTILSKSSRACVRTAGVQVALTCSLFCLTSPRMRRRAHPASFERDSVIDLVIAKDGRTDARDLLGSFDLDIVKSSFDGRFFRIEQPHDAFDKYDG